MDKKSLRIIFMGTPEFAVATLDAIVNAGYNVVGVVTVADKPAGRGRNITESDVKQYALKKGLTLLQPTNLKSPEFLEQLALLKANLQIVVAFRMLPKEVWAMPVLGTFNLHASLLPQYRGAAPINWAIINGEKETGVTTFFLNEKIDEGAVLFAEKVSILPQQTAGELHDQLKEIGSKLVVKTINEIVQGTAIPVFQSSSEDLVLKPAPKINKDICQIDWNRKAEEIVNLIRGLSPYPGALTQFFGHEGSNLSVKIYKAELEKVAKVDKVGTVFTDNKTFLKVSVQDGYVKILQIQQNGRKKMEIDEFLRGSRLPLYLQVFPNI